MKKFLLFTNLVLISTIYFQNCREPKQIIIAPNGSSKNWHCLNYNDSIYNGIPFSVSDTLFNEYGNIQYSKLTTGANSLAEDSRSVWFSLDLLKKFIYKIEDTLNRKNFNTDTRLGMRFYFATYPSDTIMATSPYLNSLPRSYAKHHTLFMVPTFDSIVSGTTVHFDFNAFKDVNESGRFTTVTSANRKNPAYWNTPTLVLGVTNETYMQNHGEVGPPPSPVPGATFQ